MPRWTDEARRRQAELICAWEPWTKSSGPRSDEGKRKTSRNAYRGGIRAEQRAIAKELRQLARQMKQNW